ncbi:ATP synthase F1 subunit epsilon [Candidatus Gottesmanbacteria bacterium]|nr:ATP synthase F1 subunit epsilon [Candidatus Gottesmanbacteria bacterium]
METFLLELITPDRIAFSEKVDMVVVPGVLGAMGILPRHEPLFAQLSEGELKIIQGINELYLSIGGGFIEVTKEKVIVLVTRAVRAHELNEQEIIKAKEEATEALKQKPSGKALETARISLRQSLVDLQVLRRRKKAIH